MSSSARPSPAKLADALLVGAPRSGSGKTMVTIGLQRAFARTGLAVGGAKCGPDYIDPAFHLAATGRPSINLDGFAMDATVLRGLAARIAGNVDLVIAEGAMGLFDGARVADRSGAAADVARLVDWPVLLVVDAASAAQSVAAVAHGCASFPGAPRIAGVVANNIASARHAAMVEDGFARIDLKLLGLIGREERLVLPSRHLGLVQAAETDDLDARIDAIAERVAAGCDLAAIRAAAGATRPAPLPHAPITPPGQRIAIARDAAFGFLYPHLVAGWRAAGAELHFFSPLADEAPPGDCDACWLPGGYPELHAGRLAANRHFLGGLRGFAERAPVHGECGGYMVLGRSIEDRDGRTHEMAGLLPIATSIARPKMVLGYRRARFRTDTGFAQPGIEYFGHEYHHATIDAEAGDPLADMADAEGRPLAPAGHRVGRVTGSFFHLIA
jgi:cobyrinic acid a,c-diamide synthase